jgi:hypothetical protein
LLHCYQRKNRRMRRSWLISQIYVRSTVKTNQPISDNPQIPKPARPPGFPAPGLDLQELDGGAQIARFPAVGNAASIQAGSRDIREIPDPSRSLALGSKDDTRLFAATGSVYHVRLQP